MMAGVTRLPRLPFGNGVDPRPAISALELGENLLGSHEMIQPRLAKFAAALQ